MRHDLGTNQQQSKYKWKPLTNHISKSLTSAEVYCPGSAIAQEIRQPKMLSFLNYYTLLLVDSGDKSFQKHCTPRQDSRSLLKVCTYSYVTSRSNSHTLFFFFFWYRKIYYYRAFIIKIYDLGLSFLPLYKTKREILATLTIGYLKQTPGISPTA